MKIEQQWLIMSYYSTQHVYQWFHVQFVIDETLIVVYIAKNNKTTQNCNQIWFLLIKRGKGDVFAINGPWITRLKTIRGYQATWASTERTFVSVQNERSRIESYVERLTDFSALQAPTCRVLLRITYWFTSHCSAYNGR